MKISSSMIQMAAEHYSQERDQTTVEIQGRDTFRGRALPGGGLFDRVDLGSYSAWDAQSTYDASMTSRSQVRGKDDDSGKAVYQQRMVERMSAAVTGRNFSIGNIVDGREIKGAMWSAVTSPDRSQITAWIRETRTHAEEEQVAFSSVGSVQTADGRIIDFTLDLNMERSLYSQTYGETKVREAAVTDPLVINLDGLPPKLTDTRFEFDLNADGTMDEISFVSRGSGFLAFDKNKDGIINDGSELFGPASGNGFEDLSLYDEDANGWIDENDAVFSQLSVWTRDEDGEDRLTSLTDAGLGAIFLGSASTPFDQKAEDGSLLGQTAATGMFLFENGNVGTVQQVDLAVGPTEDASQNTGAPDLLRPVLPAFLGSGFNTRSVSENPLEALKSSIADLRQRLRLLLEGIEGVGSRRIHGSL